MNPTINPLLLLSVVVAAVVLAIWLLARRRRARGIVERMSDQLATTAVHAPGHVRHPSLIASRAAATSVTIGSGGAIGTVGTVATFGAVGTAGPVGTIGTVDGAVITSPITPMSNDGDRTLVDMLDGIKLPYDLMPVVSVVENPDRHIVFLTTHSNAGEVGKRFADELERLGFELEPVDFDQAVAMRGDDVVSMKIVPNADQVEMGGSPRYGAAGSGDVALETWIGRSPVPPSVP